MRRAFRQHPVLRHRTPGLAAEKLSTARTFGKDEFSALLGKTKADAAGRTRRNRIFLGIFMASTGDVRDILEWDIDGSSAPPGGSSESGQGVSKQEIIDAADKKKVGSEFNNLVSLSCLCLRAMCSLAHCRAAQWARINPKCGYDGCKVPPMRSTCATTRCSCSTSMSSRRRYVQNMTYCNECLMSAVVLSHAAV